MVVFFNKFLILYIITCITGITGITGMAGRQFSSKTFLLFPIRIMDTPYNLPVSVQLTNTLIERVRSAYYRTDVRFPSESELCKEFNVSRTTVRTALAALVAKGLLVKKPGIGSFLVQDAVSNTEKKHLIEKNNKIGLVMSGLMTDGGWNTMAYRGLEKLKAQGFTTAFSELVEPSDVSRVARQYADASFDLIIGHGWEFGEEFIKLSPDYPEQKFFVTADLLNGDIPLNLQFFHPPTRYSGYMAGALASLVSQSHIIGFVGGGHNPIQNNLGKAFQQAARDAVPGTTALIAITGDYNDVSKGRKAATSLIDQGADVIWHSADLTGLGVIACAVEAGAFMIGSYSDQTSMAYRSFLSSIYWDLGYVIHNRAHAVYNGSFEGGSNWEPPFDEIFYFMAGGSNTPYVNVNVPQEVQTRMKKILAGLKNGDIQVTRYSD